jgi:hypothetical protein
MQTPPKKVNNVKNVFFKGVDEMNIDLQKDFAFMEE